MRKTLGEVKLGCLLWLLATLVFAMVVVKMGPVKIASVELYDYMREQAKFAQRATSETLRKRILERAENLELPLEAKDLMVAKSEARIRMEATYVVPIEFPGYTYSWRFHHVVDEPIFYF